MSDEKEVKGEVTPMLPGQNFRPGNVTLFQIAESHGKELGRPQSAGNAEVSQRDKEILAKAIPADKIENVLAKREISQPKPVQSKVAFTRGMVVKHKPTGEKVTIMQTDVDTNSRGHIRHEVCIVGTTKKFKVPERNLEVISNGSR